MEIYLGHHINQTDTWPLSKPIYLSSRLGTKPLKILLIHSHILSQGVCRWMCQSFYQSLICSFSLYATPSRPISSAAFFLPVTVTVPTATVNLYEVDRSSQSEASYCTGPCWNTTHTQCTYQLPGQRVVWAQSESRFSVGQGLFPVKPACVLPEPPSSCGGAAPGHWVGAQGEHAASDSVSVASCTYICSLSQHKHKWTQIETLPYVSAWYHTLILHTLLHEYTHAQLKLFPIVALTHKSDIDTHSGRTPVGLRGLLQDTFESWAHRKSN